MVRTVAWLWDLEANYQGIRKEVVTTVERQGKIFSILVNKKILSKKRREGERKPTRKERRSLSLGN
jgi:hypothetical protein